MSTRPDEVIEALRAAARRADRIAAIEHYRAYENAVSAEGHAPDGRVVEAFRDTIWQDQEGAASPGALPQPGTPYFGRERETTRVVTLLREGKRAVTLTGVAGVGKTRIALAAAERARSEFSDGVRYVELRESGADDALAHAVPDGVDLQMLLVIDNAEAALDALPGSVNHFVEAHPRSSLLVTSRVRTGIAGETVVHVEPFALPLTQASPAVVQRTPAVAFFVERAALARPSFVWDARASDELVHLCASLDGLPLALELAAAQLRFFSLRELTERVRRTDFAPTSIEATLQGSIHLLGSHERRLFDRLAVFEAPWTIAEAEAVCAGDGLPTAEVLPGITRLVESSLLQTETLKGIVRYRFLETVRRVALAADDEERRATRARAVRWYTAEMLRPGLDGIPDARAMELLAERHDALCCVLDRWCDDPVLVLRCIASSRKYWEWSGHAAASVARVEARSQAIPPGDDALSFAVARTLATHALAIGDNDRAQRAVDRMLELARGSDDPARSIEALHNAAILSYNNGDLDATDELLERVAALQTEQGMVVDRARTVLNLAAVDMARRNWDSAEARLASIAAVAHAPNEAVLVLRNRAYCAAMRGAFVAAREFAAEAVRQSAEPRVSVEWRVEVEHVLGIIAWRMNDAYGALRQYQRALRISAAVPFRVAAYPLEDAAVAAAMIGKHREAAQLLSFVDAERGRTGLLRSRAFEAFYAERRAEIAAAIGDAFAEHAAVGAAFRLPRALELVFSLPSEPPKRDLIAALSDREREVAKLVGGGATNREIAQRLAISVKTVENHLASIFGKLDASRRSQVAVLVREAELEDDRAG